MAGAYLTIGAKFRPFSYDELLKPVAADSAMHYKIEEQLGELQQKANVWENLANKETDPKTYQKYKEYSEALKAQAEDLAKNGLNHQSFRNLMNLRAQYSSDIIPIEQAYTRRRQLADEQRKLQASNPTLKFQRDMSTTSLDDFVDNPELDYGFNLNGAAIAQQAGQAYSHLAKTITSDPKYAHILGGQYWQSKTSAGYTPEEILTFARRDPDAPEALRAISKQVYDSTNVESFISKNFQDPNSAGAQEWRDFVNSYIDLGAWNAVGTSAYSTMADQEALAIAKAKAKASKTGSGGTAGVKREDDELSYNYEDKSTGKTVVHTKTKSNGVFGVAPISDNVVTIIESMPSMADRKASLAVVTGLQDDGKSYKTRRMSKGEYADIVENGGLKVSTVRVDYETGDILADVSYTDKKGNSHSDRILLDKEVVRDSSQRNQLASANGWLSDLKAAETNIGKKVPLQGTDFYVKVRVDEKGKKVVDVYDSNDRKADTYTLAEYEGYLKDQMYKAVWSMFTYTGTVNTSVEAGQKMTDATRNNPVPLSIE